MTFTSQAAIAKSNYRLCPICQLLVFSVREDVQLNPAVESQLRTKPNEFKPRDDKIEIRRLFEPGERLLPELPLTNFLERLLADRLLKIPIGGKR